MHLKLSQPELIRLGSRVTDDYRGALGDHGTRMERFRRYYQLWRNRVDAPTAGEEHKPNFSVPLLRWQLFSKWAQEMDALFGDDAEIVAVPTGPADQRIVHKIGRYMTWRLASSMKALTAFAVFEFRKLLFGRAVAYMPWTREMVQTPEGPVVAYEGPGFYPLWPDDILVPAEDVDSLQKFSFVIRKYRITPQQLLDGEREGRYFGIRDDFDRIVKFARQGVERDAESDTIKREKDEAEGVNYEGSQAVRHSLLALEWYGKWRLPKSGKDAGEDDLKRRQIDETDLVIRYLPDLDKVVGCLRLMDLYPGMRYRRPFAEASLIKEGSYWAAGFGELLESIEDETTANHRLFTEAGQFSVGPVIFYRPGAGFRPDTFKYSPYTAVPTDNPGEVNVVQMRADLNYSIAKEQVLKGYAEMVTGVSEQAMGRSIERPNAPRTATGQLALIEQGNIRASLDIRSLREDFGLIAERVWLLDSQFAPESVFFRVTEEDAKGLFDTGRSGAMMTAEERGGAYDFQIKFATSYWAREANKERALVRYQLDLTNPLIMQNPRALWMITNEIHKALGDDNFSNLIPEPPDLGLPKNPREEWTLALQGEDIEVHPMDNDDLHLIDHQRRLMDAGQDERPDMDAMNRLAGHIIEHRQQKQQKILMQALTQKLTEELAVNTQNPAMGGLNLRGATPMPLQQLQAELAGIMGGGDNVDTTRR